MSKFPIFSIIVPTHNRPIQLAACLESIVNQTYQSSNFEVIVIDDGSKFPITPAVSRYYDRLNLSLITQPNRGPAFSRNLGAAKASGRYLAFTDDDCAPAPDWLQKLQDRFDSMPDLMIGGKTINVLTDNTFSTASQDLISYLYEYYNTDKNNARFLTSNNLAVPSKSFHALGGFDPGYPSAAAEDRDFCDKWQSQGYHMIYAPEVIVYHRHNLNLRSFLMQHFGYGQGASRFHQTRSIRSDRSLRLEPLSFYSNLILYPFWEGKSRRPLLIAALLLLSQMSNAAGFFWGWTNQKMLRKGINRHL